MEQNEKKTLRLRLGARWERCLLPVYEWTVEGQESSVVLAKILGGLSCRLIGGGCSEEGTVALAAAPAPVSGEELSALLGQKVAVVTATAREMLTKEVSDGVIGLLAALPPAEAFEIGSSEITLQVSCPAAFLEQAENLARRFGARME